ncbi:DUF2637 domain-containing protein [Streptomyces hoynatensis]|uniref:DUF2637 domain-containing protein n=1 Tax=Streptomyces hoynatensis TaxID=1141874 RepID=A0A3A9ZF82_9ACTN|nr:DUF2637 domain-containing protein [Streptomyces hoynatensis]RKN45896.1 hypothetical protein D7294_05530 [Streptomyces hoynatensis]
MIDDPRYLPPFTPPRQGPLAEHDLPGDPTALPMVADFTCSSVHIPRPRRHRGPRARPPRRPAGRPRWPLLAGGLLAACITLLAAALSALAGVLSYAPLRHAASLRTSPSLTASWPLLIYGPWLVAALSVLRAALYRRGSTHSWCVVLLSSALAVVLCVAQAPREPLGLAVAGLPPLSALVAFQQLVCQATLLHPPRGGRSRGRPRRGAEEGEGGGAQAGVPGPAPGEQAAAGTPAGGAAGYGTRRAAGYGTGPGGAGPPGGILGRTPKGM